MRRRMQALSLSVSAHLVLVSLQQTQKNKWEQKSHQRTTQRQTCAGASPGDNAKQKKPQPALITLHC